MRFLRRCSVGNPENADECTLICCTRCHSVLGPWGRIQDMFLVGLGNGVFDLKNGRLSRVSRNWPPRETKLQMALRHVSEGAVRVERQRELVEELRSAGYTTDNAEKLLATFEQLLRLHEAHLTALI